MMLPILISGLAIAAWFSGIIPVWGVGAALAFSLGIAAFVLSGPK